MTSTSLPTGADLERLLEHVELSQYQDLFRVLPPDLATGMGVGLEHDDRWVRLTARGFDHPMFNRVMGLGLGPDGAGSLEAALAAAAEHYAAAGVRRWMLQVLPHLELESFREAAASRGVTRLRGWAKHLGAARPDIPARTALRLVRIGEPNAGGSSDVPRLGAAWARIVVDNFGLPADFTSWFRRLVDRDRWHLYLALDDETPAAAAALHLSGSPVGHFGQLTFAATRPEYRGRGAQSALIARRAADARRFGARWVVSETDEAPPARPNPSTRNLERLGFRVVYVRANWGPPKPTTEGHSSAG